ncbi:MAG: NAD(P)/FAD-dependent oxidoreductase, partial [Rhodanobacteraceae bacterium]
MNDVVRPPRVVILGGGFGGLKATRALRGTPVRVILIDRANHHLFQPLLYQVAAASLSGPDIAAPLRHVVRRQENVTVLMEDVCAIDVAQRCVRTDAGEYDYDWLIVATGSTHAYFGHDDWARHAPGLKTMNDALAIRRRILSAFERAECEPDAERRGEWLSFVVIGAGPTGVELAGTLAEIAHHTLP